MATAAEVVRERWRPCSLTTLRVGASPVVDLLADDPDEGGGCAREEELPDGLADLVLVNGRLAVGRHEVLRRHLPPLRWLARLCAFQTGMSHVGSVIQA